MRLQVSELCKRYVRRGQSHVALDRVSFAIPQGAFVTLLGPSGCGKSTLLGLIAGLDHPTSGTIEIGGRTVYDGAGRLFVPPGARDISMVFQSYAIWPHMTVRQNVEFPLEHGRKKRPAAERAAVVERALDRVHLAAYADRPAPLLSGGQQQRVALARAIAQSPSLLLLDEPLSNLDANLRDAMQQEIRSIVTGAGVTAVYVTHDQKEALSMSDTVIVMKDGGIEQIGPPRDVYYRPANRFVAQFMGAPNLLRATVSSIDPGAGMIHARCALGAIQVRHQGDPLRPGDGITLVLKQEDLALRTQDPRAAANTYVLPVAARIFLGERMEVVCALPDEPGQQLSLYVNARTSLPGDRVSVGCQPEEIHYFREP
ncbi:ABC transporter ATP-binding protein [Xylophilus sp.]|uniref:ABC transporter ATP-binding protein n=1 Tax=Xylophilus sp. TaxID=2653893 RepID=UPI0013B943D1|nr:ABC transporter ATP-binding protein [Xylophilus sp.]KAF1042060.1 MAG: Spermidine/putrescine import ATP-binding protein PotA [Xylophilus sp.]